MKIAPEHETYKLIGMAKANTIHRTCPGYAPRFFTITNSVPTMTSFTKNGVVSMGRRNTQLRPTFIENNS